MNLIVYHMGARGDFLAEILFGRLAMRCLKTSRLGQSASLKNITFTNCQKMHWWKDGNLTGPDDFGRFEKVICITACSDREKTDIAYLATVKKADNSDFKSFYQGQVNSVNQWQSHFEQYRYDLVVPFEKLFDLQYLKTLCRQIGTGPLTDDECKYVQHNIDLNSALLASKTLNLQ